jgi:hypothetical protein
MYACACALKKKEKREREKKDIAVVLAAESFFKIFCWGLEHTYL